VPDAMIDRSAVVAVDGPSGSGKSTTAREVARRLGYRYVDTGSMYRAVTLWLLDQGIDPAEADQVALMVSDPATAPAVEVVTDPDQPGVRINGVDVTDRIRDNGVTDQVSAVSAVAEVRTLLVAIQRRIAGTGGAVLEGRDIGTTVVPDATVKVFLTADPQVRAARRTAELPAASADAADAVAATAADLARRDHLDSSRALSPLSQAQDAVVIDSTGSSVDDVVEQVVALVTQRLRALEAEPT
jgi:cytidylate kinase